MPNLFTPCHCGAYTYLLAVGFDDEKKSSPVRPSTRAAAAQRRRHQWRRRRQRRRHMSTRPTPRPSVVSRGSSTPDDQRQHVRRGHASHDDDDDRCAPRVFRNDRLNPSRTRLLSLRPVFHHIGVSHAVRPSSFSRSISSSAANCIVVYARFRRLIALTRARVRARSRFPTFSQ